MAVLRDRLFLLIAVVLALVGLFGRYRLQKATSPIELGKSGDGSMLAARSFSMKESVEPRRFLLAERSRRVLALYDSSETVQEEDEEHTAGGGHPRTIAVPISTETTLLHRLIELPLLHVGLSLDYLDIHTAPLPTDAEMARYHGILTWFTDQKMRDPEKYLNWLIRQGNAGRRLVLLERLGAQSDLAGKTVSAELLEEVETAIGGRFLGQDTNDPSRIKIEWADPKIMAFEGPLPARQWAYSRIEADPGSNVYLRMRRTDIKESISDMVWSGAHGGYAHEQTLFREDELGDRRVIRWVVDPFRFLSAAFGVDTWPRPDFTTVNGERVFYSHIDGDGLDTLSELDYKSRCGEVVRDRLLRRYDLPFTASVVVGLTAPPPFGQGSLADVAVARSIFALDNIEVGSHGYAHPLNWRSVRQENLSVRGLPDYRFTNEDEVMRSVEYIDSNLVPPGKRCMIMLWTGWCNPTDGQLEVAYRLGLRNLNGGDPRMDAHYPSYAHLVAPIHRVGKYFQYYTSAANDYILTERWTPPYYRFQNVIQTFERTASPRRIVPINVYFHFYIARNYEALTGIQRIFDWVTQETIAPRFASEYVDMVRDTHWARIAEPEKGRWIIRKGRALRTVRFDNPDIHIDQERSTGVVGYLNHKALGVTYIHLSESPEVTVQLAETDQRRPRLERATHDVDHLKMGNGEFSFMSHGVGKKRFVFQNFPQGQRYSVRVQKDGEGASDVGHTQVTNDGRLEVIVASSAKKIAIQVVQDLSGKATRK